ncbi:hypothetical protein F6R98_05600 [Candidatus Methylospira mobilis]|uniref:Uncharacterized protein n=1 Tax=Candidatus Methylospira mobilis TaxID=1808979 RepID=A0A5Q0BE73_9GAMM|nr:hypothetical protein [Candidatus Methylospira mobilis]QFY42173.1 hypothetical protein F6R98_05600 [Candidatus Methylospira mobilis]WNV03187.1 hypothetical protein RP726_11975 [Candidatus Methylospira mobilis]
MPKFSIASISMSPEQTRLLAESNSFRESGGIFVDQNGTEHPYHAGSIWYDDFGPIITENEEAALSESGDDTYAQDIRHAGWSHIEIVSAGNEEMTLLTDCQKDFTVALIAALRQTDAGCRMMAISCAHRAEGKLAWSISLRRRYALNHESRTFSLPSAINGEAFEADILARINGCLQERGLPECALAVKGHTPDVSDAVKTGSGTPTADARASRAPDASQIEMQIQKLRAEANRRVSSLTDIQTSLTAINEREQAVRARESAETERDVAIAAKERLLQQAQNEERLRVELQEKIEALSAQIETLQTRIKELNGEIAKKDEVIAALTEEKLQLNETVKTAENNASKALENSRAWQAAATEEINAHAITAADRDALLNGLEQLDQEVKRHAAAFHKEMYELEQSTRAQIENLTKELQNQSQQAATFIQALNVQTQATQRLIDGFKQQMAPHSAKQEGMAAALQTDSENEHPDNTRTEPDSTPHNEPAPHPLFAVGMSQVERKHSNILNVKPFILRQGAAERNQQPGQERFKPIATTLPRSVAAALAAPIAINDGASHFPRKLRRLSQPTGQEGKNHQLVWQNVKDDLSKAAREDGAGSKEPSHYVSHAQKAAVKNWQNKFALSPSSNDGSIQWRRNPGEIDTLSSRADQLESNISKLAELSMSRADIVTAASPVDGTSSLDHDHAGYTKNNIVDNNGGRRMRAVIAAGLSTLSVSVLIAGLAIYAATDGTTLPMRQITAQLHGIRSAAAHLSAITGQLLQEESGDYHPAASLTRTDAKETETEIPDVQQIMSAVFEFDAGAMAGTVLKPFIPEELADGRNLPNANTLNATQVAAIFPH